MYGKTTMSDVCEEYLMAREMVKKHHEECTAIQQTYLRRTEPGVL